MIELHDNECICIDDTFAILGTVECTASLTNANPLDAAASYRARRMALVWTTIAPAIPPGRSGHAGLGTTPSASAEPALGGSAGQRQTRSKGEVFGHA